MQMVKIGPADAPRLEELLRAAEPGICFELTPGDYPVAALLVEQDVIFEGSDPQSTRILFQGRWFGVVLQGGRLQLKGLTLCNGEAMTGGGIAAVNNAEPTLDHCILSGNWADSIGGTVHLEQSGATVTCCLFPDDEAQVGGALVINEDAQVQVINCLFGVRRPLANPPPEPGPCSSRAACCRRAAWRA